MKVSYNEKTNQISIDNMDTRDTGILIACIGSLCMGKAATELFMHALNTIPIEEADAFLERTRAKMTRFEQMCGIDGKDLESLKITHDTLVELCKMMFRFPSPETEERTIVA